MDEEVNNKDLQILQWNSRSIENKMYDLSTTQKTLKPHIIGIQETWLKDGKNTPLLDHYHTERKDRVGREKGGILMYIHNNLTYINKNLNPYPNGNIEIQAITIKSNKDDIDIVNLYNPNGTYMCKQEIVHTKTN